MSGEIKKYGSKKRVIIGLIIILLLGLSSFALFILRSRQIQTSKKNTEPLIEEADIKVEKMDLSETEGGDLEWSLKADEARVYEKEGIAYLKKITLAYSRESGEKVILTGDFGEINLLKKDVFLQGNVEASSNQIKLKTKALSWFREERILSTEESVWLRRENIEITGHGMVADMDLRKIKFIQEVTTIIY